MSELPVGARAIRLDPKDTVAILIEDAEEGAEIVAAAAAGVNGADSPAEVVRAAESIPYGHKVALSVMDVGDPVIKYGEKMGIARKRIAVGEHVHVHNVRGLDKEERSVSGSG